MVSAVFGTNGRDGFILTQHGRQFELLEVMLQENGGVFGVHQFNPPC